jgi:hypothetical protein
MILHATKNKNTAPLLLAMLSLAGGASAADAPDQTQQAMQAKLIQSEAVIANLQQRVQDLEQRLNAITTPSMVRASASASASPMNRQDTLAQASPSPTPAQPAQRAAPGAAAPRGSGGRLEVDEAAAQRALERTLTQAGALLLPAGTIEFTPSFSFARFEQNSPVLTTVVDPRTSAPALVLGNQRVRTNDFTPSLGLRVGLKFDSQLELGLPYNHVRTSTIDDFGNTDSRRANGIGDLTVGLAKTFAREKGWTPDLVGRLTYNTGTGKMQSGLVNLGSGFRQLSAEVIALKRQDPLAFTASLAYGASFEEDSIKPGDLATLSLGAALAASPATSLQLAFTQVRRQRQELNGVKVPGSDQTYAIASIGASSVLTRDTTLVTQFGIGLGQDAPKYTVMIGLPILFR